MRRKMGDKERAARDRISARKRRAVERVATAGRLADEKFLQKLWNYLETPIARGYMREHLREEVAWRLARARTRWSRVVPTVHLRGVGKQPFCSPCMPSRRTVPRTTPALRRVTCRRCWKSIAKLAVARTS